MIFAGCVCWRFTLKPIILHSSNAHNPLGQVKYVITREYFYPTYYLQIISSYVRADSRFAPSQWETALLCNDVSRWLGANLESALYTENKTMLYVMQSYLRGWQNRQNIFRAALHKDITCSQVLFSLIDVSNLPSLQFRKSLDCTSAVS